MKKTGIYTFVGIKSNGAKCSYNLYEYDELEPKFRKKYEALQRKIINTISNKKYFVSWYCDYKSINDNIKESEAIKCRI